MQCIVYIISDLFWKLDAFVIVLPLSPHSLEIPLYLYLHVQYTISTCYYVYLHKQMMRGFPQDVFDQWLQ